MKIGARSLLLLLVAVTLINPITALPISWDDSQDPFISASLEDVIAAYDPDTSTYWLMGWLHGGPDGDSSSLEYSGELGGESGSFEYPALLESLAPGLGMSAINARYLDAESTGALNEPNAQATQGRLGESSGGRLVESSGRPVEFQLEDKPGLAWQLADAYGLPHDARLTSTSRSFDASTGKLTLNLENKLDGAWYRMEMKVPVTVGIDRVQRIDGTQMDWFRDGERLVFYDDPSVAYEVYTKGGYQEYYVLGDDTDDPSEAGNDNQLMAMYNDWDNYFSSKWGTGDNINPDEPAGASISFSAYGKVTIYLDEYENGYGFDPATFSGHDAEFVLERGEVLELGHDDTGYTAGSLGVSGQDRFFTAGGPVFMVRVGWPMYYGNYLDPEERMSVGRRMAGCWEQYPVSSGQTSYVVPLGEDLYHSPGLGAMDANYTSLIIQAFDDYTRIKLIQPTSGTLNIYLDRGESYTHLSVEKGTILSGNKSFQAGLFTSGLQSIDARSFTLTPYGALGNDYYIPVSAQFRTFGAPPWGNRLEQPRLYLYAYQDTDVHFEDRTGIQTVHVTAGEVYFNYSAPQDSAIHVYTDNPTDRIWMLGAADSGSPVDDFGFQAVDATLLNTEYFIPFAPNPTNSYFQGDHTQPLWITPVQDATIVYVDFDADGVADESHYLNRLEYVVTADDLNELDGSDESWLARDSAMTHLWSDKPFAVTYGVGSNQETGDPSFDFGYTVLPFYEDWMESMLEIEKTSNVSFAHRGELVRFQLVVTTGAHQVEDINITDMLPVGWDYLPGATMIEFGDGSPSLSGSNAEPVQSGSQLTWRLVKDLPGSTSLYLNFTATPTQQSDFGEHQNRAWAQGRDEAFNTFSPMDLCSIQVRPERMEEKQLYLHRSSAPVSILDLTSTREVFNRTYPTGVGEFHTLTQASPFTSYMFPGAGSELRLLDTINVTLRLVADATTVNTLSVWLREFLPDGSTEDIARMSQNVPAGYDDWMTFTLPETDHLVDRGNGMRLDISTNQATNGVDIHYSSSFSDSRMVLLTPTFINVQDVGTFDELNYPKIHFYPGQTVRVNSNVTDPFGAYDISSATVTILDPLGAPIILDQSMATVDEDPGTLPFWREFRWDHALDGGAIGGTYIVLVVGLEGNGVTHTSNSEFYVSELGVSMYPDSEKEVPAGLEADHVFTLENTGIQLDNYDLLVGASSQSWRSELWMSGVRVSYDSNGDGLWDWVDQLYDSNGNGLPDLQLSSGASANVLLKKFVPSATDQGALDLTVLTARSWADLNISATVQATTNTPFPPGVIKELYLHPYSNSADDMLNRLEPTGTISTTTNLEEYDTLMEDNVWKLMPPLNSDFHVQGTAQAIIYLQNSVNDPDVRAMIYDDDVELGRASLINVGDGWNTFNIPVSSWIDAGSQIKLLLEVLHDGGLISNVDVVYDSTTRMSRLELPTDTYIEVEWVRSFNEQNQESEVFDEGHLISIRAYVTDPFGDYDIVLATLRLTDPSDGVIYNSIVMPIYSQSPRIYEYNYFIPMGAEAGIYTANITAYEGNGVTSYGHGTFWVGAPGMTLVKTAPATAPPGSQITYNIYYNNTGTIPASKVWINDSLPMGVTFVTSNSESARTGEWNWTFSNVDVGPHLLTVTVLVDEFLVQDDTLVNSVHMDAFTTGLGIDSEDAQAVTTVAQPILTVEKGAPTQYVTPGDLLEYTIWLNNTGGGVPSQMWVNDTLPNGVSYLSCSAESNRVGDYNWIFSSTPFPHELQVIVQVAPGLGDGTVLVNMIQLEYKDDMNRSRPSSTAWFNVTVQAPIISVENMADTDTVPPNGLVTYTLWYNNTGSGIAGTVWLNDTLPNNMTYVSSSLPYDRMSGQDLGWVLTDVVPGTHQLTLIARVDDDMALDTVMLNNTVWLDFTDANGNLQAGSADNALVLVQTPTMTLDKRVEPAIALPGQILTYTIWYNNTGSQSALTVWVNDTLPVGVNYLSSTQAYDSITGQTLGWILQDVSPGVHSLQLVVSVDCDAADGLALLNGATLDYSDQRGRVRSTPGAQATTVIQASNLTLTKFVGESHIKIGEVLHYELVLNVSGSLGTSSAWVNDTLPDDISLLEMDPSGSYDPINMTLMWHLLNLTPGQSFSMYFNVTVEPTINTSITNLAWVDHVCAGTACISSGVSNEVGSILKFVPIFELEKLVAEPFATPGSTLNYTIWFNNAGLAPADVLWLNDTLPNGTIYISSSEPYNWTDGVGNGATYGWIMHNIAPGNHSLEIQVQLVDDLLDGQILLNNVTLDYQGAGEQPPREDAGVAIAVRAPVMELKKRVDLAGAHPNEVLSYTIWFNNTGSASATTVWVNDTLPQGTTYAGSSILPDSSSGQTNCWVFANVLPGSHALFINVTVDPDVISGQWLNNTATLDYVGANDIHYSGLQASASTQVLLPRFTLEKRPSIQYADPGDLVTFTIWFNNSGNEPSPTLWLNDTLPPGLSYVTSSIPFDVHVGATYGWSMVDVGVGAHLLEIEVRLNDHLLDLTLLTNQAALEATYWGGQPLAPLNATALIDVRAPTITLEKNAQELEASVGEAVHYQILVNNTGSGDAANVWINDTLEPPLGYLEASSGGIWDPGASTIRWVLSLPAFSSVVLYLNATVEASPGSVTTWQDEFDNDTFLEELDSVEVSGGVATLRGPVNQRSDLNPIIQSQLGDWKNLAAQSPVVIFDDGIYKMWYSARAMPYALGGRMNIGYAISIDGQTWTDHPANPVLSVGTGAAWDEVGIYPSSVVYENGTFRMWYWGYSSGGPNQIGMATSTDGITWVKDISNPVFSPSASGWDDTGVFSPSVLKVGSKYWMWYSGFAATTYAIGLATSLDGITWTRSPSNPCLENGLAGEWDSFRVHTPEVIDRDGKFDMWYIGSDGLNSRIGMAYSTDGTVWTREESNPILEPQGSDWESGYLSSPSVVPGSSYDMIYYAAKGFDYQIGLAFISLGYARGGTLLSEPITPPANSSYWDLTIQKTELQSTWLNITILNASTGLPLPNYIDISSSQIDLSSLPSGSIKLMVKFKGNGSATPILDSWNITFRPVVVNQATGNYTDANGGSWSEYLSNEVVVFTSPSILPNLTVEKTRDLTAVYGGGIIHYMIYINNTGNGSAFNVWINDTIDQYANWQSFSDTPIIVSDTFSWYIPELAAGGQMMFWLNVSIDSATPHLEQIDNLVDLSYLDDPGSSYQSNDSVWSIFHASANISIQKCVDEEFAEPGELINYTMWFNNTGLGPSETIWITDILPIGVTYITSTAESNRIDDFNWTFYNVSTGTHSFAITVLVDAGIGDGAILTNHAYLEYTDDRGSLFHNSSAWANVSVRAPDLSLKKTRDLLDVYPNDIIHYVIFVNNTGSGTAYDVWVNDTIDQYAGWHSYSDNPTIVADVFGDAFSWHIPMLAAGERLRIYLNVTVESGTPYLEQIDNIAELDYQDGGGWLYHGNDSVLSIFSGRPIITVEKYVDHLLPDRSDMLVYTIYYNNTGGSAAGSVWINDTLPAWVSFATSSAEANRTGEWTWLFFNVQPGSHSLLVTVKIAQVVPELTVLTNYVDLNYTDPYGNPMGHSSDTATSQVIIVPAFDVNKTYQFIQGDVLVEPSQYVRATAGMIVPYDLNITNQQAHADTVNLEISSLLGWSVSLFEQDGITPLADTNGDGLPDTGLLAAGGGTLAVVVKVTIPGEAEADELEYTYIIGMAENNSRAVDVAKLTTQVIVVPKDIIIITDLSYSMRSESSDGSCPASEGFAVDYQPLCDAQLAQIAFINDLNVSSTDRIALMTFADVSVVLRQSWTLATPANKTILINTIKSYTLGLYTPLWAAVYDAIQYLDSRADNSRTGFIVILTDGDDTRSQNIYPNLEFPAGPWDPLNPPNDDMDGNDGNLTDDYDGTTSGGVTHSPYPVFSIGLNVPDGEFGDTGNALNETSQSSNATYYFSPTSDELAGIFGTISGEIAQRGADTISAPKVGAAAGDILQFTLAYNNTSMGTAADLWVNDTLPQGLVLLAHNASVSYVQVENTYSWHFTNVAPGNYWFWYTVEVSSSVREGQGLVNLMSLNLTDLAGREAPGNATFVTIPVAEPQFQLEKVLEQAHAYPGDQLNYTIWYNNTGNALALFVWLNDTLDPNLEYLGDDAPVSPSVQGRNYSWKLLGVVPGSHSFNLTVRINTSTPNGTTISNMAQVDHTNENNIHKDASISSNTVYLDVGVLLTSTTIEVWGSNIALNWTMASTQNVDHYRIYRVQSDPDSFTFAPGELVYNSTSCSGCELATTWNDTAALLDTSNDHYYVARAVDIFGIEEQNNRAVGKFVIGYVEGWNMLSLPLQPANPSTIKVLETSDWLMAWTQDPMTGMKSSAPGTLTQMDVLHGYWVYFSSSGNLTITGQVIDSVGIPIRPGWNLIGVPSVVSKDIGTVLSGISWERIMTFDAATGGWLTNDTDKPASHNDIEVLEPGRAYWVWVSAGGSIPFSEVVIDDGLSLEDGTGPVFGHGLDLLVQEASLGSAISLPTDMPQAVVDGAGGDDDDAQESEASSENDTPMDSLPKASGSIQKTNTIKKSAPLSYWASGALLNSIIAMSLSVIAIVSRRLRRKSDKL